jgi:DNA-binding MarR family transcriptional regulator
LGELPEKRAEKTAETALVREPLSDVMSIGTYVPSAIVVVSNSFAHGGSTVYHRRFGIRVNDWRILNAIAITPGRNAKQLTEVLRLDKAVVSRSVAELTRLGLIGSEPEGVARRLYLTERGVCVHQGVLPLSRQRERVLTAGFSEEERAQLLSLLMRMVDNLEDLKEVDAALAAGTPSTD